VTLLGNDGGQFVGELNYDGPYSGTLTVEHGPNGERFTGRFVVVDRTSTQTTQGALVVPQGGQIPTVGTVGSASSGHIDASGFWYAVGDKGSKMDCTLEIGRGGHGHGTCKHINGAEYRIVL
jgi:hypothetical protein